MDVIQSAKGIVAHRRHVLLLKHKDVPDGWILPGGQLFENEPVRIGLRRQVKDETGLDISIQDEVGSSEWTGRVDGAWSRIFGRFFACTTNRYDVTLDADHMQSKWINPHEYEHEGVIANCWPVMANYLKKYG